MDQSLQKTPARVNALAPVDMVEVLVPHAELSRIYDGFAKLVNEPSERSAIIVLSARIESLTENSTARFLPNVKFSGHARRLDALLGLGVLDDAVYKLLKEMANVRNHYAHSDDDCSLKDLEIKDKVRSIILIGDTVFDTKSPLLKMEEVLSPQMAAHGIPMAKGWFTTDLRHLFFIATCAALYLLALAHVTYSAPPRLLARGFSVRT